eukprot:GHVU01006345.1.p1 GENE.GHVU01006345.1~~GHVU01006345.1.p1  ORF type:complete len:269 (+),score=46.99 GHVU01006345.1:58-864(+)
MNFGYHHQGQMPFQKPEGALKRANELISIGQHMAALELLHGTIQHKKFRTLNNDSHVESVLTLFVDLCVKLDKFKHVREGLIQNRNLAQQTNNMATFGRVLVDFRSKAEARLKAAKRRGGSVGVAAGDTPAEVEAAKGSAADETAGETAGAAAEAGATETAVAVDTVEDLESAATPESLMQALLQTESGDGAAKEITTAMRLCLDAYKMILDLSRQAPSLEKVYHETARAAFAFFAANNRPVEFKRLCDTLRANYAFLLRSMGMHLYS